MRVLRVFGESRYTDRVLKDGFIELNGRPGRGIDLKEEILETMVHDSPMAYRQYRHTEGSWKGW